MHSISLHQELQKEDEQWEKTMNTFLQCPFSQVLVEITVFLRTDNWKYVQERSPSSWQEEMMTILCWLHLEEPAEGQNCTL